MAETSVSSSRFAQKCSGKTITGLRAPKVTGTTALSEQRIDRLFTSNAFRHRSMAAVTTGLRLIARALRHSLSFLHHKRASRIARSNTNSMSAAVTSRTLRGCAVTTWVRRTSRRSTRVSSASAELPVKVGFESDATGAEDLRVILRTAGSNLDEILETLNSGATTLKANAASHKA